MDETESNYFSKISPCQTVLGQQGQYLDTLLADQSPYVCQKLYPPYMYLLHACHRQIHEHTRYGPYVPHHLFHVTILFDANVSSRTPPLEISLLLNCFRPIRFFPSLLPRPLFDVMDFVYKSSMEQVFYH